MFIWVLQLSEHAALGRHLLKNTSLDLTFLPIFTFIILGRLAARWNLKIMKTRTPLLGQPLKVVDVEFFFSNGPMENRTQVAGYKTNPNRLDWEKQAKFRDDKSSIRAPEFKDYSPALFFWSWELLNRNCEKASTKPEGLFHVPCWIMGPQELAGRGGYPCENIRQWMPSVYYLGRMLEVVCCLRFSGFQETNPP